MKLFDNYEISPCRRYEEPDSPGKFYFEVCEPHEADVWTLYGHVNGEGVQAIGDFTNRESAEEIFCRITGLKFTGSYQADAHLRIMHMGPKLLTALKELAEHANEDCPRENRTRHFTNALDQAHAAIAEAEQPDRRRS
jgi:hypothetical protein